MAVRIQLVRISHLPGSRSDAVIIADRLLDFGVLGLLGKEGVSIEILLAANFTSPLDGIDLEDGVVGTVNIGVNSETEEMLVVVCVNTWVDFCSPAFSVLAGVHCVGV